MKVFVNGESREVSGEVSLDALLEIFSLPRQRIAIEKNKEVVRRKDWETTRVNDGDKIEIVHFVGGG